MTEATDDEIVTALEEHFNPHEYRVYPGMSHYAMDHFWFTRTQIERLTEKSVELRTLRRLVKDGRLFEAPHRQYGPRGSKFTIPRLHEAMQAEANLSDAERAERTAHSIEKEYDRRSRSSSDSVYSWPCERDRGSIVGDGITQAIEAKMIRQVNVHGLGTRYVPEGKADAWQEAYDHYRRRQEN
jgi:hypothetical protein